MDNTSLTGSMADGLEVDVVYVIVELLVGLVAITGNSLVIIVFVKYASLRKITNYYVMSLATADLLVGVFGIPFAIATSLGLPHHFQVGSYICKSQVIHDEGIYMLVLSLGGKRMNHGRFGGIT